MAYTFSTLTLESLAPCFYPRLYHLNVLADSPSEEEKEEDAENSADSSDDEDKKQKALTGESDFYGSYWLPPLTRLSSYVIISSITK